MRQEGLIPRYRQDRENISRAIIQRELGSEENSSRYFAVRHENVCVCIFAKQRMKKRSVIAMERESWIGQKGRRN